MMFTLFDGEKYFDKYGVSSNFGKDVICDVKSDFFLKKLDNYTLLDALKTLDCAKQNAESGATVRMIYPEKNGTFWNKFFHRNCYYLQEISIYDFSNLYNRLANCNLYLLEDVIAALCANKTPKKQGWLYVARHRKWRIICGVGKGIILSRSITGEIDIKLEIDRTLVYLKRFKLADEFCVFTYEKLMSFFQKNHASADIPVESFLVGIAEKFQIPPVCKKRKSLSIAITCLSCTGAIAFAIGLVLSVWNEQHSVVRTNLCLKNNSVEIVVNEDNVNEVRSFLETISNEFLPWNDFCVIRKKYPYMNINKISLNNNEIKIYTTDLVDIKSENISVDRKNGETTICIKK